MSKTLSPLAATPCSVNRRDEYQEWANRQQAQLTAPDRCECCKGARWVWVNCLIHSLGTKICPVCDGTEKRPKSFSLNAGGMARELAAQDSESPTKQNS